VSAHAYSEKELVEQSTEEILIVLGWTVVSAAEETFGARGTLGRESTGDVAIEPRARAALTKLNPSAPRVAIDLALDELLRDRVAMGPRRRTARCIASSSMA
jgi:type I restriction enzyme R subunit